MKTITIIIQNTTSHQAFEFIAQYSLSNELFEFLHSLSENENDSVLEAVNDFDESLTDTKTMVDFATLKRLWIVSMEILNRLKARHMKRR